MTFFSGSVNVFVQVGASISGPGTSMGNNASTGPFSIGATSSGASPGANSFAEIVVTQGLPSELAALDAYFTARYGAGLT